MTIVYYADLTTNLYLGAQDETVDPPENSFEVPFPPDDITQVWLGNAWGVSTLPKPDQFIHSIISDPNVPSGIVPFLNPLTDPELQIDTWATLTAHPPDWLTDSYRLQLFAWALQANIVLE